MILFAPSASSPSRPARRPRSAAGRSRDADAPITLADVAELLDRSPLDLTAEELALCDAFVAAGLADLLARRAGGQSSVATPSTWGRYSAGDEDAEPSDAELDAIEHAPGRLILGLAIAPDADYPLDTLAAWLRISAVRLKTLLNGSHAARLLVRRDEDGCRVVSGADLIAWADATPDAAERLQAARVETVLRPTRRRTKPDVGQEEAETPPTPSAAVVDGVTEPADFVGDGRGKPLAPGVLEELPNRPQQPATPPGREALDPTALAERGLPVARRLIASFVRRSRAEDPDEIESDGLLGLANAARSFRPGSAPFEAWAVVVVRRAVLAGLRARRRLRCRLPTVACRAPDGADFLAEVAVDRSAPGDALRAEAVDEWRLASAGLTAAELDLLRRRYVDPPSPASTPSADRAATDRHGLTRGQVRRLLGVVARLRTAFVRVDGVLVARPLEDPPARADPPAATPLTFAEKLEAAFARRRRERYHPVRKPW